MCAPVGARPWAMGGGGSGRHVAGVVQRVGNVGSVDGEGRGRGAARRSVSWSGGGATRVNGRFIITNMLVCTATHQGGLECMYSSTGNAGRPKPTSQGKPPGIIPLGHMAEA